MWRILSACLVAVSLVAAHHDGTAHPHEEEHKALIMLEIEPNVQNSTVKDKRSPQHRQSQAVFGASPGQFVVRTTGDESAAAQPDVPAEYINLLQQLVAQEQQGASADTPAQQPVIHQLLVARNPDPSAVQFSSSPSQPQRPRRPPSPQAQLQQLYFNSQFQQQIPVRPRLLRPPPRPAAPSQDDFPTSQVHSIHEARLRASLAGSDPNLAVQSLAQPQSFPSTAEPSSPTYEQQLQLATASQEHLTQLQTLPQPAVPQQTVYTPSPQVRYVQQPQPVQRAASYHNANRQSAPSQQLPSSERSKLSRRPSSVPAPEQYLRETTQSLPEQSLVQVPAQQQTSDPKIYLASQSGQQNPSSGSDEDELIAQLLSGGRGFFPSSSPAPSTAAEEIIRSTTALPPTASRSSIYVTQTNKVKGSPSPGKITIEEVGATQEDNQTPIPVVHLPTPEGQRPLTQSEFQALVDAGFNISPVPQDTSETIQTLSPQYYQQTTTTKKQRSYVTPAPPPRNQVEYQGREKKPQEEKEVRYVQQVQVQEQETPQRIHSSNRYRLQGSKPQQQEEVIQFVPRPAPQESRLHQGSPYSRFRIVVNKDEPNEETIQFIHIPTAPEAQEVPQREQQLSTYEPEDERIQQTTQLHRLQDERESAVQTTKYQPDSSESDEPTYQTQPISLSRQTPSYRQEQSATPQVSRLRHPIIVAELPSTTPVPSSSTPRRRRPRPPSYSRIVFRSQVQEDGSSPQEAAQQQYLVSYDSVPEASAPQVSVPEPTVPQASSFGTRNRVRGRRPSPSE